MTAMTTDKPTPEPPPVANGPTDLSKPESRPKEVNGPKGLEPTRYGDWEHNGRCSDF